MSEENYVNFEDLPQLNVSGNLCFLKQNFLSKEYSRINFSSNGNNFKIGQIVIFADDTNPSTVYGGTWTKVAEGRTLWGAGQNEQAGQTADGKVPNITGGDIYASQATGCFFAVEPEETSRAAGTNAVAQIIFDASQSNQKYTNDNIVQHESYLVNF